ncbi:MAG: Dabb family protein [Blastocatellia bacterium]|nr:Dabb family protein [Blastocatellia bacterium]
MSPTLRRIFFGCALVAVFIGGVIVGQTKFDQPKSVIHVVTGKWKADSTPEQQQKVLAGVKEMAGKIPGIKNIWIKPAKIQPADYNFAFVIEFESEAAYKAYGSNPEHDKWSDFYHSVREESRNAVVSN